MPLLHAKGLFFTSAPKRQLRDWLWSAAPFSWLPQKQSVKKPSENFLNDREHVHQAATLHRASGITPTERISANDPGSGRRQWLASEAIAGVSPSSVPCFRYAYFCARFERGKQNSSHFLIPDTHVGNVHDRFYMLEDPARV